MFLDYLLATGLLDRVLAHASVGLVLPIRIAGRRLAIDVDRARENVLPGSTVEGPDRVLGLFRFEADHVDHAVEHRPRAHLVDEPRERPVADNVASTFGIGRELWPRVRIETSSPRCSRQVETDELISPVPPMIRILIERREARPQLRRGHRPSRRPRGRGAGASCDRLQRLRTCAASRRPRQPCQRSGVPACL